MQRLGTHIEFVDKDMNYPKRMRVLALVLDEVIVDAATGDAELHLRGCAL